MYLNVNVTLIYDSPNKHIIKVDNLVDIPLLLLLLQS
jgi:hypothetical protein